MSRSYPYTHTLKEATEWGEVEEWRESFRENCRCAHAIEDCIRNNFDGTHLNDCARTVIDAYGFHRVRWVLANTLRENREDGRYSDTHRQWLAPVTVPKHTENWLFVPNSHPAVLDGFIEQVKREWEALGLYDKSHCIPEENESLDYTDRVLIYTPNVMKESRMKPEEQLFLAQGGFGCAPQARGRKIFGVFLCDGEQCHILRQNVIGAIREECLPEWAAEKLREYTEPDETESWKVVQS